MTSLAALRTALAQHPLREIAPVKGRTNHIEAAVLVPLVWGDRPTCVLTERAHMLREHPGELCFPGGRPEAGDENLRATALRETAEEIGVRTVDVIGVLSSMPLATSDHRLFPFVGLIDAGEIRPSAGEVAAVHTLDVLEVLAQPYIDAIAWHRGGPGHSALVPIFDVGGRVVYGGTAAVLHECLGAIAPVFGMRMPELRVGTRTWEDVLYSGRPG
jgi:8-oxo-dGTP pyrophosphatase MutT (NUDIX family)